MHNLFSILAANEMPGNGVIVTIVLSFIGLIILLVGFVIIIPFFSTWLQAYSARANVSFFSLIGMRLRKVDTRQIVQYKITASQAGLDEVTTGMLESHYL